LLFISVSGVGGSDDDASENEQEASDANGGDGGNNEEEEEPMVIYENNAKKKNENLRRVRTLLPISSAVDDTISVTLPVAKQKKPESLSTFMSKMVVSNSKSSSSSSHQNHLEESNLNDDSDFVSDEWAGMVLDLQIHYGNKRTVSSQPSDLHYAQLVDFIEKSNCTEEKTEAGMWLNKFIAYFDKHGTLQRKSGRSIKTISLPALVPDSDPESTLIVKTSKRRPKKLQVDLTTKSSPDHLLPQNKKKFKVLTPETIAIMKTNFDLAFHRTYDKEDSGDNRFTNDSIASLHSIASI